MRDFNVDALDHETNQKLWNILEGYDLVVSGPTRHGGLLDHVYLLKSFMGRKRVALLIKDFYFSDHEAVKFLVSRKILYKFLNKLFDKQHILLI